MQICIFTDDMYRETAFRARLFVDFRVFCCKQVISQTLVFLSDNGITYLVP